MLPALVRVFRYWPRSLSLPGPTRRVRLPIRVAARYRPPPTGRRYRRSCHPRNRDLVALAQRHHGSALQPVHVANYPQAPDKRTFSCSLRPRRERPRRRRAAERGQEFSSCDVACHVTLPWKVMPMQWRDDIMLPSRGQRLRPIGKSSECLNDRLGSEAVSGLSTFFENAAIQGEMWLVDCTGLALRL